MLKAWKVILLGLAVGVIAGGAAAYVNLKVLPAREAVNPLASARIIPDEALAVGFVSTDPNQWAELQQFGTPEAQTAMVSWLGSASQSVLTANHIDLEKDVLSWAGSAMVAVLPATTPDSMPHWLVVVGIRDQWAAWEAAQQNRGKQGVTVLESRYKDVSLLEVKPQSGSPFYAALLNHHIVLAQARTAVEQAIDTSKGEPSLATQAHVATFFSGNSNLKHPLIQFYLPDYAGLMRQVVTPFQAAAPVSPQVLQQLETVKAIALEIGVNAVGLQARAVVKVDPASLPTTYQPTSSDILNQFPADTLAVWSGQGINQTWALMVNQFSQTPESQTLLNQVRQQLQQTLNLNLDTEVMGWMDGEFALGILPTQRSLLSPFGFGGVLLLETTQRSTAQTTLDKVDAIARSNQIDIAQKNLGSMTVTEWRAPLQPPFLGHGWLDPETLMISLGGPITDTMAGKPTQSLVENPTFQAIAAALPRSNSGYLYLNMEQALAVLNQSPGLTQIAGMTPETQAILNSIRGFGMVSSQPDPATVQTELLLALKPNLK